MKSLTNQVPDRFTRELVKGTLNAARAEMEALIARTAMSPFIREKKDYFTAFLDRDGALVVSTALTLAGNLVDAILDAYPAETMRPGDLYAYNDAYGTGGAVSHLPDMVFVMPVFHDGRLIAFAEAWGHLWDIGGSVPGSISPHATSVFQEGIMIPPVRLVRDGQESAEILRIIARNSRYPEMLQGDLRAIMAACRLGVRRLEEIVERHGANTLEFTFASMLQETEQALRHEIGTRITDGTYAFRDRIDSDAVSDRSYHVDLVMRKQATSLEFDFSQSDRQADGPINFVMDRSVPGFMLGLWMCMDRPEIGMNSGFQRAVDRVITRPGSLVAPHFPAPLGLRSHTMIRVTSAMFGALAQATGGQASAAPSVYVLYYLRGRNNDGSEQLCIEGLSVGFGARTFADGIDAVYYVAQENYPIEFAELEFGVEIEAFSIHRDSGGAGRWRGGCGIVRDIRVLSDQADLGLRIDNCRQPAFGVNGGRSGRAGCVIVNPDGPAPHRLKTISDGNRLCKGDLIRIITPGGGGWGNPVERPAESVLDDVLDGFVSPEAARQEYGVILSDNDIDRDATEACRASMKGPSGMFHRGIYFDAEGERASDTG